MAVIDLHVGQRGPLPSWPINDTDAVHVEVIVETENEDGSREQYMMTATLGQLRPPSIVRIKRVGVTKL